MKTFLMHPDRDFDGLPPSPQNPIQFAQDLELDVLLNAAAAGDRYLYNVMSAACASAWTNDLATVSHRHNILKDCLANADIVRQLYAIAIEPFSRERNWDFGSYGHDPSSWETSDISAICTEIRSGIGADR